MSLLDDLELEESEEVNETTKKPYAYCDKINNKKVYLFARADEKVMTFELMKDGSNLKEYQETTKGKYIYYSNVIDLDKSSLIRYDVDIDKNDTENSKKAYTIDNGFYEVKYTQEQGYFLMEIEQSTGDNYIDLGEHLNVIDDTISKFYSKKSVYEEHKLKHKMGMLLYGPPGNGKSVLLRELTKKYKDNKVVIFVDTDFPKSLIKNLKSFKQEFMFIFEEFTQNITRQSDLANMLLFLDGENSLDNQLVLATTNYPEHLPANLASRPGRFDKLIKVGDPDEKTRRLYLEGLKIEVTDEILRETKDFSIAYLREIFVASKINDTTLLEEIKVNKKRKKLVEKAFAEPTNSIGLN